MSALRILVACGLLAAAAAASDPTPRTPAPPDTLPTHPAQLAPLTLDGPYPRFHPSVLASAGYPDHRHVYAYPGYEPPVDEEGRTYGLHSLSRGTLLLPREGLETAPGEIRYRRVRFTHDPEIEAVGLMPAVEMIDWAQREVSDLLGRARPDTLHVLNPLDLEDYEQRTGYGFHRLYWREGSRAVIEPANVLFARGLVLHAMFHLATTWELEHWLGDLDRLPRWFSQGLASYVAEDGMHFLSYLKMYRREGPVILDPERTEAILASAPDPDQETDKVRYRKAGYSAYLMMWELVEHRGGLRKLLRFIDRVAAGEDVDAVCRDMYGMTLPELTSDLDATRRPEPVGEAVDARPVHRPPGR